jgi:hypothetical protein
MVLSRKKPRKSVLKCAFFCIPAHGYNVYCWLLRHTPADRTRLTRGDAETARHTRIRTNAREGLHTHRHLTSLIHGTPRIYTRDKHHVRVWLSACAATRLTTQSRILRHTRAVTRGWRGHPGAAAGPRHEAHYATNCARQAVRRGAHAGCRGQALALASKDPVACSQPESPGATWARAACVVLLLPSIWPRDDAVYYAALAFIARLGKRPCPLRSAAAQRPPPPP